MTSIDKQDIHWPDYSRGSKFGKIIAYGIGAKLTIIAGFLFNMMANKKERDAEYPFFDRLFKYLYRNRFDFVSY